MIYCTPKRIQIGDIEAFKQMIEDAIHHKKVFAQTAKQCKVNFSHNDKHYPCKKKLKIDSIDKGC